MSKIEYHHGKLRPADKSENETFEEFAKRICNDRGITKEIVNLYGCSSFMEYILSELEFVYNGVNNTLYEIYDHETIDEEDFIFQKIDSNSFEFMGGLYNGTSYLSEVLEGCLKDYKDD